jgi:hypothetical protein
MALASPNMPLNKGLEASWASSYIALRLPVALSEHYLKGLGPTVAPITDA